MFDLTSSKLLILGIVALIVVGPKELPFLLRTVGKYVAMLRRQANEFRAQFDEAMREAELDGIKKDLENVARETETTLRDAQSGIDRDIRSATDDIDHSIKSAAAPPAPEPPSGPVLEQTFDVLNGLAIEEAPATPHAEPYAVPSAAHTEEAAVIPTPSVGTSVEPVPSAIAPVAAPHELAKTGT